MNTEGIQGELNEIISLNIPCKLKKKKIILEVFEAIFYFDGLVWFALLWWVLWHINNCRLFNAKSIFIQRKGSISNNSV